MVTPNRVEVNIDLLEFDPENPRLPTTVNGHDQSEVLNWLLKDSGLIELMSSIASQGYFSGEPLLGVMRGDSYVVVEGNRRLAALKLLKNPNLAKISKNSVSEAAQLKHFPIDKVPMMVYPERRDILAYLGYRHVTGIKEWGPLEKARYLKQLIRQDDYVDLPDEEKYRKLARVIGSRANYVKKLLLGLDLYGKIEDENFYDIEGLDEESISFSLITTALDYSNISKFLGLKNSEDVEHEELNAESLQDLTTWMFQENEAGDTRLGESRNLKTLNAVVSNNEALSYFRDKNYPLSEAALYTDEPLETYRNMIFEARDRVKSANDLLSSVRNPSEDDIENVTDLIKRLHDIRVILRSRLQEDEL